MKSILDLILERLNEMSDDEIVKATNYRSESSSCNLKLEDHDFYYSVSSKQAKNINYNEVELRDIFEYKLETNSIYADKAVGGYKPLTPLAA